MTEEQEIHLRTEMRKSFEDPHYSVVVPFEVSNEDCLKICKEIETELYG